jgi:dUTP pyrophosphatase
VVEIPIVLLTPSAKVPARVHGEEDAGWDLFAAEDAYLPPAGGRAAVSCGFAMELPRGLAALVLPRSGLALRHGVTCLNAPGLIDPGYRGEVKVILVNHDPRTGYEVRVGDRVAQMLVLRAEAVGFRLVGRLMPSARGDGGFGHTGR